MKILELQIAFLLTLLYPTFIVQWWQCPTHRGICTELPDFPEFSQTGSGCWLSGRAAPGFCVAGCLAPIEQTKHWVWNTALFCAFTCHSKSQTIIKTSVLLHKTWILVNTDKKEDIIYLWSVFFIPLSFTRYILIDIENLCFLQQTIHVI